MPWVVWAARTALVALMARHQVDGLMYTGHEDDDLAARRASRKAGRA